MTFVTQAIETRYLGPTNTKGARIKATAAAGRATVPYDYELDVPDAHRVAADALIAKMGWQGTFAQGGNVKGAKQIGTIIAERLTAKGIRHVVFDRGGFLYHGRVRAVAEAARAAGLEF